MTNSEIKNCPFCGAEISDHFNDDKSEATHLIGNIACFLTGVILKKDVWNTRTPEPTKLSDYACSSCGVLAGHAFNCKPEPTNIHKLDFEITKIFEELRVMHDVPKSVLESLEGLIRKRNPEPTKAEKNEDNEESGEKSYWNTGKPNTKAENGLDKLKVAIIIQQNLRHADILPKGSVDCISLKDAEHIAHKICQTFATPSITKDGDIYNIIDSPSFLTTHILRNWERERIEKFAKHLLGDLHLSITKEQPREIDFDKLFEITASVMKYGGTGHLVAIKVMEAYNTGKLFKPATINDKGNG